MARPVYILGAGFSKTIHDCMPVTAELNKLLSQDDSELQIELNNQTFENWLTINSTDLPFLEKFENTARKAQSEKIINKARKQFSFHVLLIKELENTIELYRIKKCA